MKLNKVQNFSKNIFFGFGSKAIGLIFPFMIRTIMIRILGTEYLGISSLFSAILQALNLFELGMGSALVFNMYESVAKDDKEELSAYLLFYKKCYRLIGFFVLAIGLIVLPFLKNLIKGTCPSDINIYLVYLVYLLNTVLTYWLFSYKNSIALAYQRTDIESKTLIYSQLFMFILQIISLFVFRNYYYYIIWLPLATIVKNIIVSIQIDKIYPGINAKGVLDKGKIKSVFSNIKALFGHQVAFTVINSADSIILSSMLGLNELTIYNNYYYILNALSALLTIFFQAIQAGIGNSIIVDSDKVVFQTFKRFRLITFITVEVIGLILYAVYNQFMELWMGKNLMLDSYAVLIFTFGFFVTQVRRSITTYKNAAGLWKPDIIKPYIVILFDIIIDLFLINKVGSIGAMISTIVSMGLIAVPWESAILFKHVFKRNVMEHFIFMAKETIWFILGLVTIYFVNKFFPANGWLYFTFKLLLSSIISVFICVLVHYNSDDFKWSINRLKVFLKVKK